MIDKDTLKELTRLSENIHLLYVEDDVETRENTLALFKDFFTHITVAIDGHDGLEQYRLHQNEIDLIITDIAMPKLNGIEMIQAIRKENPNLTILVFSAHSESNYFIQTIEIGVDGYLIKPMQTNQLVQILLKSLQKIELKKENAKNLLLLRQYESITNKSSLISKADKDGIITYVNEKFCEISGYEESELIGQPHSIIRHPDMPKSAFRDLWHTIKNKKAVWQGIIKNRAKNGDAYYVKATIKPILDEDGNIQEYISLRHDITSIMSDKKQLFDYLESNKFCVLILVQIEDYTVLEKFYDKMHVEKIEEIFGRTLLYLMPNDWGFQRVYNLESGLYAFAIDRRSCKANKEEIEDVLERFLANVKEYIVKIDTIEYDISAICSYTYGVFKVFEDAKIGIEKAIKNRESIIYADGFSGVEYKNALKNIETIHTIKVALDNKKIISYFQPIINNATLQVEKYESLVRLINEEGNVISPFHFLEVAKKGRYYSKITKIVLDNSFLALTKTDKEISINLSVFDIESDIITNYIYELLNQHAKDAHRIIFELLESDDIRDFDLVRTFISTVKQKGVKIAIDDFGTGYSNFERLLEYQPDILKIDGSLIKNMQTNKLSKNIIETIVIFAKKQNIKTVAEFVENEELFKIVLEMNIDYSQGYVFGKPQLF